MPDSEDAHLILKLYDLRREKVMREARQWFGSDFHPTSADAVMAALQGDKGAYLRMIGSYWEMAASLVNHGTINATLFNECNGEHFFFYAKMEPYLSGVREKYGPRYLTSLEKLVKSDPRHVEILQGIRQRMAAMAAARK